MTAVGARSTMTALPARAGRWATRVGRAEVALPVRVASWLLGGVAALGIWLLAYGLILSTLVESHAQHDLYNTFRAQLAEGTAPVVDTVHTGRPVALFESPRGDLQGTVGVQGSSATALRLGPGHVPGTVLPGQVGVSVFFGRATSFGAPFAHLTDLAPRDRITVTTGQGRFSYEVVDLRRAGDRPATAFGIISARLTLVTSEGVGWRAGWAPSRAVFVDAVLVGRPAATPEPGAVRTPADGLLAGDTRGFYPMVLWLQLLAVTVAGGVWARRRWGRWQAWTVSVPVGLTALWGATGSFWLLLPNLF